MDEAVLNKLKLNKQNTVAVLNPPEEFLNILGSFNGTVDMEIKGEYSYIQIFIYSQKEILDLGQRLTEAVTGDGLLWICYPKGTSKKYKKCDCNRDTLREVLIPYGFEGISLISLDEDWSAMRVRNSAYIKSQK